MARKTKQEAQETRSSILDAAVRVFAVKGVGRASLDDIAREAGVTRGAIYWHFANKADLLNTLWDQVLQFYAPLAQASEAPDEPDPLGKMKELYLSFFSGMVEDQRLQQLFRLLFDDSDRSKETVAIRHRHAQIRLERLQGLQATLDNAKQKGQLPPDLDVRLGAISVLIFIYGLTANWIMTPDMFDIRNEGQQFIDGMIQMLQISFQRRA